MTSEVIVSDLDGEVKTTFFEIIRHLEKAPKSAFRQTLVDIGNYSKYVRGPLKKQETTPTRPLEFTIGFENALPIYQTILSLCQDIPSAKDVFWNLNDEKKLFAVYKLWKPGIMTTQQLAEFVGADQRNISSAIRRLEEHQIIERKTLGIYGIGANGNLAMRLFALLVVMWRRHTDSLYSQEAHLVASRVSNVLEMTDSLSDALDKVDGLGRSESEPIVVTSGESIFFLEPFHLSIDFCIARDTFLDSKRITLEPLSRRIEPLLREGRMIDARTRISEAYRVAISNGGTVFLRRSGELYYLRPECVI